MIAIKKTGEGYYLVALKEHKDQLVKNDCQLIKTELTEIIKPHREISLDIKGIINIDSAGFKVLKELKTLADSHNCKVRFINVEPLLIKKITKLSKSKTIK